MPYFSERNIEIPKLLEFLDRHSDEIETVLDVGCAGSQYLEEIKKRGKVINGVDMRYDEKIEDLLKDYTVADFLDLDFGTYDFVICLSTIEHYGVKQKPDPDYTGLQLFFFERLVLTAKKFLFVTFPYGEPAVHPNEFSAVYPWLLDRFLAGLEKYKVELEFYFNEEPQKGEGWRKIEREEAGRVKYDPSKGVQCVCILKVEK